MSIRGSEIALDKHADWIAVVAAPANDDDEDNLCVYGTREL